MQVSMMFYKGALMEAIKKDFGSFENFKQKLSTSTVAVQGSGWGWLVSVTSNYTLKCRSIIIKIRNVKKLKMFSDKIF